MDNGIAVLVYIPSSVKAKVANGVTVQIEEETAYPFDETLHFKFTFEDRKIKRVFFPFHIRIPAQYNQPVIKLNGENVVVDAYPGEIARINREWKQGDVLIVELPIQVAASRWYGGSVVIERGPLAYALKMNKRWEEETFEGEKATQYGNWYYQVTSDSPWNYALTHKSLEPDQINDNFVVEETKVTTDYPWNIESAPITIKAKGKRLNGQSLYRDSSGSVSYFAQQDNDMGDGESIELIPYGCTTLCTTEFPVQ